MLRQVRNRDNTNEKYLTENTAYIPKGFSFLNLYFAYFVKISSNVPARIRAYNSDTKRDADVQRPSYIDPRKRSFIDHGIIFDVILGVNTSPSELLLAPIAFYAGSGIHMNYEPLSETFTPQAIVYYLG